MSKVPFLGPLSPSSALIFAQKDSISSATWCKIPFALLVWGSMVSQKKIGIPHGIPINMIMSILVVCQQ